MPTERQLLVHSLKSLGYIGDLRKGKQSDFEKLLKEYQNASKFGFQYAQWDLQTLQQYLSSRHQQLHRKIKKVFTAIRFVIRIKPKTTLLTAGVASQYDYTFLPDTWFSKSVSAVAQICSKTNAVLPVVLESYPFYFKIELNCTLVNIEDGTTIDKTYLFPADHAIKISSIKHISDLNNTLQLWIQNSFATDDSVPDTKHRVHEFIAFKLKLAKSQQGGCKGYTVDSGLKNKRCLKNPDLKDNLCFWRCIAIALYESSCQGIQQANSKQQREKAIALRDQYFAQCGQNISDHVQVADLPVICQTLNLDLTVYTLDDNLNSLKLYESGIQGSPICMHLDQPKNHYMLLRTLVGYAETIICDKCKKVFAYSKASKYHNHMAKHQKDQNSSKVLVFKDKPIQSSISLYKQSFGTELVRPLFLAYDFECILKKMNNSEVNQKTTYTHSHEPIGVVMLAGGCLADQARGFEYEYCGPDAGRCFVDHLNTIHDSLTGLLKTYFWKHHNKQMAVIESQKCSCQYTLQHRSWCKETTSTDQPCKCGHCRQHKKGCKYIVIKCLIMKEYLSIPIIGFNSGKYDLTFIITHMQKYDISPPITKTNSYMKLEYGAYAFLDAHNYVPPTTNLEKFGIMWGVKDIQKELFPYEWFDSLDKLSETSLPPIECFYNKLRNTLPSETEYQHAVKVWKEKQFASFGEYMMYYCRCDVELLLQGTSNYRSLLMTKNNMELLNYVSVAQISYQNILKNYLKHDLRTIPVM
ncbi:hypothetical protein PROFUN_03872, partial [Planoprotostelium fungivorum]